MTQSKASTRSENLLTAIFPTRNRVYGAAQQIQLFKKTGFRLPLIVADSSDDDLAARLRTNLPSDVEYVRCQPDLMFYDKLASVADRIDTPFVVIVADRKITFPHTIEIALEHLTRHDDYSGAQGYVVGFDSIGQIIDINRVLYFTSSINEQNPLERQYQLMRRYQPWLFGVFRTDAFRAATNLARSVSGAMFQEILFANAMALQGKLQRIQSILTFQSPEYSQHPVTRNHPFYWFLDDSRSFFSHYAAYTDALKRFISERGIVLSGKAHIDQLIDNIHALWLHSNFDYGTLSYYCQFQLGYPIPPIPDPRARLARRPFQCKDTVFFGRGKRTCVWRDDVINAQPKDEICISVGEVHRVQKQIDLYFEQ